MKVTEQDVLLIYLPMGLNWGYFSLLQTIMAGARAVLLERFSARAALELIQRERVTYIATAPASIVAILNDPELATFDTSSLRVVITGGASAVYGSDAMAGVVNFKLRQDFSGLQFDGGYVPFSTVLQADQQLFPAQLTLAQDRAQVFSAAVSVYQSLGGGWVTLAEDMTVPTSVVDANSAKRP
jgi:non-ribosomal peptide synthetase component E (peptide arylation enzyme)